MYVINKLNCLANFFYKKIFVQVDGISDNYIIQEFEVHICNMDEHKYELFRIIQ